MAITYDAVNNIITVTGYTEGIPCTFEDIYQADVAGGWGVVSKQGVAQYLFDCRLYIGDGSTETWFADQQKEIEVSDGVTPDWNIWLWVKVNANMRWGVLTDETEKLTKYGVHLVSNDKWNIILLGVQGTCYLYGSTISSIPYQAYVRFYAGSTTRLWNIMLDRVGINTGHNINAYRITISYPSTGIQETYGTLDEIFLNDATTYGIYTTSAVTISNLMAKQNPNYFMCVYKSPSNSYLINAEIDNWNFLWVAPATGKVYRQYEFDAHCQDKEGNDLSGVSVVAEYISPYGQAFSETTNASGDIPMQTVDHGWFEQATGNTENLKTPLKVTYSKAGYQTVVKYYDLDEKTKDVVVLHKAVGVFLAFGRPVINLKKTDPENKNVMVL